MLSVAILGGTAMALVGAGLWARRSGYVPKNPSAVLSAAMTAVFVAMLLSVTTAFAQDGGTTASAASGSSAGLGFIGAALSTGLACVGAGIAVAFVGAAALGVVGEKPALFGTTLIYMGLAEGIAIYGLVISLFILNAI